MAGKKSFHPDLALGKAMDLFWEQGYEGSSIEDLVQCTGLGRGSLYDTFGDKHALYIAALKRYLTTYREIVGVPHQPTGSLIETLERFFQTCITALLKDPARRGCFLVNATIEMAPHDPEIHALTQTALDEIEEGFYRLLIQAQVGGEIPWTYDPHQYAHFLLGTLISIRTLARAHQERSVLQNIVKTTLSVFR